MGAMNICTADIAQYVELVDEVTAIPIEHAGRCNWHSMSREAGNIVTSSAKQATAQ